MKNDLPIADHLTKYFLALDRTQMTGRFPNFWRTTGGRRKRGFTEGGIRGNTYQDFSENIVILRYPFFGLENSLSPDNTEVFLLPSWREEDIPDGRFQHAV